MERGLGGRGGGGAAVWLCSDGEEDRDLLSCLFPGDGVQFVCFKAAAVVIITMNV